MDGKEFEGMDMDKLMFEIKKDKESASVILAGMLEQIKPESEIEKAIRAPGVASACCIMMLTIFGEDIPSEAVPDMVSYSQQCFRIGAYIALSIRDTEKLFSGHGG